MRFTRYAQEITNQLSADPHILERETRRKFGMSSADVMATSEVLASLVQGRMPSSAHIKYVQAQAAQRYNMSAEQTNRLMKTITTLPNPQDRITAYLTGGGRSPVDAQTLNTATQFVEAALYADTASSLAERLESSQSNHKIGHGTFAEMKADKRVIEDSASRDSLRQTLSQKIGADTSQPTLRESQARVATARMQLADRIEASSINHATAGTTPSLRESLSEAHDFEAVAAASRELGLGDPKAEARQMDERENGHLRDDFDVTENLRGI